MELGDGCHNVMQRVGVNLLRMCNSAKPWILGSCKDCINNLEKIVLQPLSETFPFPTGHQNHPGGAFEQCLVLQRFSFKGSGTRGLCIYLFTYLAVVFQGILIVIRIWEPAHQLQIQRPSFPSASESCLLVSSCWPRTFYPNRGHVFFMPLSNVSLRSAFP